MLTLALFLTLSAFAAEKDQPCAVVMKSGGTAEMQVKKGEWVRLKQDTDVSCGALVSSRENYLSLKHRDGFQIWASRRSIFTIDEGGTKIDLESGQILLRGTAGQKNVNVYTSRGQVEFTGGVAAVIVDTKSSTTQVAVFAESVLFRNRFFPAAEVKIKAAKISELTDIHERIAPTQPAFIDPATVRVTLSQVGLAQDEAEEFSTLVAEERERQERSFASEFSTWKNLGEGVEEGRSLASEPKEDASDPRLKDKIRVLNPVEEARAKQAFEQRLLGQEQDYETDLFAPRAQRMPASVPIKEVVNDVEFQASKKKQDQEKSKVLKEITELDLN